MIGRYNFSRYLFISLFQICRTSFSYPLLLIYVTCFLVHTNGSTYKQADQSNRATHRAAQRTALGAALVGPYKAYGTAYIAAIGATVRSTISKTFWATQ